MPLVSIIVPVFNAEKTLRYTLNSILSQSFIDYEVLIINDLSTDSSHEIIDHYVKFDDRFKGIHLEKNFGAPAGPRNIGIDLAKGRWIAFLDSDDIWHEKKLEKQINILEKTGALFASTSMFNFSNNDQLSFPEEDFESFQYITFKMQMNQFLTPTSSVVVAKDIISKIKFNESLEYKAREDVDCFLHCHEILGHSIKIKGAMLAYRISEGQISGNKIKMIKRHYHVLKNYRMVSGKKLNYKALWFTLNHFIRAIIPRFFQKKL